MDGFKVDSLLVSGPCSVQTSLQRLWKVLEIDHPLFLTANYVIIDCEVVAEQHCIQDTVSDMSEHILTHFSPLVCFTRHIMSARVTFTSKNCDIVGTTKNT